MTRAHGAQQGPAAHDVLLRRSDAHLVAADLASDPAERFVHGHLAGLRAAAALVTAPPASSGAPGRRRGRPRSVWLLLAEVAPELEPFATAFTATARVRAAVDAGRPPEISAAAADRVVAAAEDLQDAVRSRLGHGAAGTSRSEAS